MEAPVYYCGLPALLLMPQAFKFIRLKLKILFSLLLLSVLVYICFAYPRLILFGFFGCYYRIAANFVTISLLFISVHALHFIHKEFKVDTGLLLMTLLALITPIATSVIVLKFCDNYILDSGIIISIICFLLIYCVIIRLLAIKKTRFFAMVLFFLALSFELALFSYTTVNKRFALRSDYIKSKTGYFDYTNDAIAYLNSVDKDFYRIIRGYDSVQHADALFQNWKGTKAYGQWNHKPVRDFLIDMDVEQEIKSVSWICGFGLRYKLDTLMGVKYLLVKDKHSIPNGFEFIENIDDIYIYKNKLYLPLGFTYNTFVKYEDFMDFPLELKDNALLTAFVWQGGSDILTEYGIKKKILPGNFEYNHDNAINTLKRNALNIISYNHSSIQGNITLDEDGLLFLSIPFDRGWKLKVDGIFANMHKVNIGFIGILLKKGFHKVDLRYFVPFLDIGIIISCVGLFIYLLLVIRQRKSDQCTSS